MIDQRHIGTIINNNNHSQHTFGGIGAFNATVAAAAAGAIPIDAIAAHPLLIGINSEESPLHLPSPSGCSSVLSNFSFNSSSSSFSNNNNSSSSSSVCSAGGLGSENLEKTTDKNYFCQRCLNHAEQHPRKGHKPVCRYRNCRCDQCQMVEQRRRLNNALNTRKPGDGKQKAELNGPKPRHPKCARCTAHGVEMALRGHKKAMCPFNNCRCEKCGLVEERRKLMAAQIKLRRRQKKAREGLAAVEPDDCDEQKKMVKKKLVPKTTTGTTAAKQRTNERKKAAAANNRSNGQSELAMAAVETTINSNNSTVPSMAAITQLSTGDGMLAPAAAAVPFDGYYLSLTLQQQQHESLSSICLPVATQISFTSSTHPTMQFPNQQQFMPDGMHQFTASPPQPQQYILPVCQPVLPEPAAIASLPTSLLAQLPPQSLLQHINSSNNGNGNNLLQLEKAMQAALIVLAQQQQQQKQQMMAATMMIAAAAASLDTQCANAVVPLLNDEKNGNAEQLVEKHCCALRPLLLGAVQQQQQHPLLPVHNKLENDDFAPHDSPLPMTQKLFATAAAAPSLSSSSSSSVTSTPTSNFNIETILSMFRATM